MSAKLPIYYDYANVLGTLVTPGEIKDQNNLTAMFFRLSAAEDFQRL